MPIRPFTGNTFVAFIDIAGFKMMMKNNDEAVRALTQFYQAGYNALDAGGHVQGFFVSDCGILFSDSDAGPGGQLSGVLSAVKAINERMLDHNIMLTTSISYGHFSYTAKAEFEGIDKNPVYGQAYLDAYLDGASGKPKLEPGQCRILLKRLENTGLPNIPQRDFLHERGRAHVQYFWNVRNAAHIGQFEQSYNDAYKRKYLGMLHALKNQEY